MIGTCVYTDQTRTTLIRRSYDETVTADWTWSPDASYGVRCGGGDLGGRNRPTGSGTLKQAEVVGLAKTAAKKEKDKALDDYDLKSVTFDRTNREWSLSCDPKRRRRASGECFLVIVKDDTKRRTFVGADTPPENESAAPGMRAPRRVLMCVVAGSCFR